MGRGKYFEDFVVGEESISGGRTITEADIVNFAGLTGDWYELHTNKEWAAKGPFGQRIAHGALIFSIATGLALRIDPPSDGLMAFYGLDHLRFVKPVFIGDTIHVKQAVIDKTERNEMSGVVTLRTEVIKQDDQVAVSYTAKVLYKRRIQE
ncbi:MAG: MaoC family dehydratase N-terminal domain-containing protein [Acidobacteria bacterium]|nr:MaoC family dehydratase N-terminal domain-containing protein [Acidobacteriota bacterium]